MQRLGGSRTRSIVLVALLGSALIAVAVALNIGFIVVNWRAGACCWKKMPFKASKPATLPR